MSTPEATVYDDCPASETSIGVIERISRALETAGIDATPLLYEEALELARNGLLGAARDRLRMLLCLDPENGDAHLLLAKVFVHQQRWADALSQIETARALGQQVPSSLRAKIDAGLESERNAAEQLRERTATREQAELTALRAEARRLRTENTRLARERKQAKGRAGLWSASTAVLGGVSLVLVAFTWLDNRDAAPRPEALAPAPSAIPTAEAPTAEAPTAEVAAPAPPTPPAALAAAAQARAQAQADAEVAAVLAAPAPAVAPAKGPRTHKVQAGDNLYTLAQRYYGDGEKWGAIKEANPGKISKHHGLGLGTELLIP